MDPTTPPPADSVPPPPPPPPQESIPNYMVPSVLVALCCCPLPGIAAIVFAAQVNSKKEQGDYAGARESSRKARLWMLVGVGLGVLGWIAGIAFGFVGVLLGLMGA